MSTTNYICCQIADALQTRSHDGLQISRIPVERRVRVQTLARRLTGLASDPEGIETTVSRGGAGNEKNSGGNRQETTITAIPFAVHLPHPRG